MTATAITARNWSAVEKEISVFLSSQRTTERRVALETRYGMPLAEIMSTTARLRLSVAAGVLGRAKTE